MKEILKIIEKIYFKKKENISRVWILYAYFFFVYLMILIFMCSQL